MLLPLSFLVISLVYSVAGLGGGSAYIACMVLFGLPSATIPAMALACNVIVATLGFIRYRQAGFFRKDLFLRLAITSIPASYLGGLISLPEKFFTAILAVALALAAFTLLFWNSTETSKAPLTGMRMTAACLGLGAGLGLLSGITGVGGGIYLVPLLVLLRMSSVKEAAAVGSLFIVINSASGLVGQLSRTAAFDWNGFWPLAIAVFAGGFLGSKLGAAHLKGATVQKIVGLALLVAAIRLIF